MGPFPFNPEQAMFVGWMLFLFSLSPRFFVGTAGVVLFAAGLTSWVVG